MADIDINAILEEAKRLAQQEEEEGGGLLELAAKKYDEKIKMAPQKYVQSLITKGPEDYARGLAEFLGVSVEEIKESPLYKNYENFVNNPDLLKIALAKYIRGVEGKGKVWAENYKRAVLGTKE